MARQPRYARILIAALLACICTRTTAGAAPNSAQKPADNITFWGMDEGLPQSTVSAAALGFDGALWIGTYGGLTRFDGEGFDVRELVDPRMTPSIRIVDVLVAPDGDVWAAAEDGWVFRVTPDGTSPFERHRFGWGDNPLSLALDGLNRVIVGTVSGVFIVTPGASTPPARHPHAPRFKASSVAAAPDGSILAASAFTGLAYLLTDDGAQPIDGDAAGGRVVGATDGVAVVFSTHEATVFTQSGETTIRFADADTLGPARSVSVDPDGSLVLGFAGGVRVLGSCPRGSGWDAPQVMRTERAPLGVRGRVNEALLDRAGQLWFGTMGKGLVRMRDPRVRAVPLVSKSGLSILFEQGAQPVLTDGDRLIVGAERGIAWGTLDGLTDALAVPERVHALAWLGDGSSRAYASVGADLCVFDDGELTTLHELSWDDFGGVETMLVDTHGALWIGTSMGLRVLEAGELRDVELPERPLRRVTALAVDAAGDVWAASDGVLMRRSGDGWDRVEMPESIGVSATRGLVAAPDGGVWAATYGGGLVSADDRGVRHFQRTDGLPEDTLTGIAVDRDAGIVWLSGNRGVYRFRLEPFATWVSGVGSAPGFRAYERADGALEGTTGSPSLQVLPGDRLLANSIAGPQVVSTGGTSAYAFAPPTVTSVWIDGEPAGVRAGRVGVPAHAGRVELAVSAPNLVSAGSTRIEHRIEALGEAWSKVGPSRRVAYTNLPPGEHRFELRAQFGDGGWTAMAVPLVLDRAFAWHEYRASRLAIALSAVVVIAISFILVRRRNARRVDRLRASLDEAEAQRRREARLLDELNHRVRNNLGSVLTLLDLSAGEGGGGPALRRRIHTMASVHGILSTRNWSAVRAGELVEGVVESDNPNGADGLQVEGGDVPIHPERVQSLAMVLHELAANAREHGAWSVPSGSIGIRFQREHDSIRIAWRETGGPPAEKPAALGTGLTLARGFVEHDLRGTLAKRFEPSGLSVDIAYGRLGDTQP